MLVGLWNLDANACVLCRSELFESGWVKNTSLGEGSWGGKSGMEKLMGQQEAEGTVTIKSGRDRVAELKVVARVSSPLGNHHTTLNSLPRRAAVPVASG
eukprot:COSAG04_NODE_1031_length_8627_cov_10.660765_9_plen_99_part_00